MGGGRPARARRRSTVDALANRRADEPRARAPGRRAETKALAERIFDTIQGRYEATARDARAAASADAPTVAFVQYFAPYPSFGLPESWRIETQEYLDELVRDAGGSLPAAAGAPDTEVISYANVSDVLEALEGIDYIVDLTYAADPFAYDLTSFLERFGLSDADADGERFPFLGGGNVFRVDGRLNDGEYGGQYGLDWCARRRRAAPRRAAPRGGRGD